jgi:hypothetical protein
VWRAPQRTDVRALRRRRFARIVVARFVVARRRRGASLSRIVVARSSSRSSSRGRRRAVVVTRSSSHGRRRAVVVARSSSRGRRRAVVVARSSSRGRRRAVVVAPRIVIARHRCRAQHASSISTPVITSALAAWVGPENDENARKSHHGHLESSVRRQRSARCAARSEAPLPHPRGACDTRIVARRGPRRTPRSCRHSSSPNVARRISAPPAPGSLASTSVTWSMSSITLDRRRRWPRTFGSASVASFARTSPPNRAVTAVREPSSARCEQCADVSSTHRHVDLRRGDPRRVDRRELAGVPRWS